MSTMGSLAITKEERDRRRANRREELQANLKEVADQRMHEMQVMASAFKAVYRTPEGELALEYIMQALCMIDAPVGGARPSSMTHEQLVEYHTRFNIGQEINRMIHAADDKEVIHE